MTGQHAIKQKPVRTIADFVTALSPDECRERLARSDGVTLRDLDSGFTPITQRVLLTRGGMFTIERTYPGALFPIRFVGHLDPDESGGTWVHGAITHDVDNQVMLEGLAVFVLFFLLTAMFYVRLGTRAFAFSLPVLTALLVMFAVRWRVLRHATGDITRWLRQRLYVTEEQARRK